MYISKPTASMLPALLAAEQVAGAADLEVERRDAEAAAEIAELFDRRQPLAAPPATALSSGGISRYA